MGDVVGLLSDDLSLGSTRNGRVSLTELGGVVLPSIPCRMESLSEGEVVLLRVQFVELRPCQFGFAAHREKSLGKGKMYQG